MWPAPARLPSSSAPDAPERLRGADEDLPVGNRGRAESVVVQVVFGEHLEPRAGLDDAGQAVFVRDVNLPVSEHRRCAVCTRAQALPPVEFLSATRVQTEADPAV